MSLLILSFEFLLFVVKMWMKQVILPEISVEQTLVMYLGGSSLFTISWLRLVWGVKSVGGPQH